MPTPSATNYIPWLEIQEQPADTRSRYDYEGRKIIYGKSSTDDHRTYPCIQAHNFVGTCRIIISLLTIDGKAHPFSLEGTDCVDGRLCKEQVDFRYGNDCIEFPGLHIRRVRMDQLQGALRSKQLIGDDPLNNGFDHMQKEQLKKISLQKYKLCFQVSYTDISGAHQLSPVCSQVIHDTKNAQNLKIVEFAPKSCSISGGEKMMMNTGHLPKAKELEVRFYQGLADEPLWEENVTLIPRNVRQSGIVTVDIPEYTGPSTGVDQDISVKFQLRRRDHSDESEPQAFTYISEGRREKRSIPPDEPQGGKRSKAAHGDKTGCNPSTQRNERTATLPQDDQFPLPESDEERDVSCTEPSTTAGASSSNLINRKRIYARKRGKGNLKSPQTPTQIAPQPRTLIQQPVEFLNLAAQKNSSTMTSLNTLRHSNALYDGHRKSGEQLNAKQSSVQNLNFFLVMSASPPNLFQPQPAVATGQDVNCDYDPMRAIYDMFSNNSATLSDGQQQGQPVTTTQNQNYEPASISQHQQVNQPIMSYNDVGFGPIIPAGTDNSVYNSSTVTEDQHNMSPATSITSQTSQELYGGSFSSTQVCTSSVHTREQDIIALNEELWAIGQVHMHDGRPEQDPCASQQQVADQIPSTIQALPPTDDLLSHLEPSCILQFPCDDVETSDDKIPHPDEDD